MSKTQLPQIRGDFKLAVASPCHASWDDMTGDELTRFCGDCQKNVYNISGMSRDEAVVLVQEKEGDICIRFYQRADGTVLTADCEVGLAAVGRRFKRLFAALLALLGFFTITGTLDSMNDNGSVAEGPLTRLKQWTQPPVVYMGRCVIAPTIPVPPIATVNADATVVGEENSIEEGT
jgi:hypothetical protein